MWARDGNLVRWERRMAPSACAHDGLFLLFAARWQPSWQGWNWAIFTVFFFFILASHRIPICLHRYKYIHLHWHLLNAGCILLGSVDFHLPSVLLFSQLKMCGRVFEWICNRLLVSSLASAAWWISKMKAWQPESVCSASSAGGHAAQCSVSELGGQCAQHCPSWLTVALPSGL